MADMNEGGEAGTSMKKFGCWEDPIRSRFSREEIEQIRSDSAELDSECGAYALAAAVAVGIPAGDGQAGRKLAPVPICVAPAVVLAYAVAACWAGSLLGVGEGGEHTACSVVCGLLHADD